MISSWTNKLVGLIIILFQMTSLIQCSCDRRVPYFPVYYPEVGKSFTVQVNADYEGYIWRKEGRPLAHAICNIHGDPNCTQPIYSISKRADLHFRKITLKDSGKYILELFCPDRRINSFKIVVHNKPFVYIYIDCDDMTVNEGDNVTCVCKTTSGYPSAVVTWTQSKAIQENSGVKNFTDILTLENISRNQSGTYTCFANSRSFVNKTSFNLEVVPKNSIPIKKKVKIEYFQVFQKAGVGNCEHMMICKAEGIPEPRYTISHQGTAVEYGNIYTVDAAGKNFSLGQYECLARNEVNSDRRLLLLNASFLVKSCLDNEKVTYKDDWRFGLIVAAFSFLPGILFVCILICFCKKFIMKEDDRHLDSQYVDVAPRSAQQGLGTRRENEMTLRHTSSSPGNEELRHREEYGLPVNVENRDNHVYYNESCYQEYTLPESTSFWL